MKVKVEVFNTLKNVPVDKRNIINCARKVWSSESKRAAHLNIILVNDDYIIDLNKQFFGKSTTTDVISFPLSDETQNIFEGEIYINVEQVERQSQDYGVSFEEELLRMVIHGILHFLGYEDKTESDKEKMRSLENKFLFS